MNSTLRPSLLVYTYICCCDALILDICVLWVKVTKRGEKRCEAYAQLALYHVNHARFGVLWPLAVEVGADQDAVVLDHGELSAHRVVLHSAIVRKAFIYAHIDLDHI